MSEIVTVDYLLSLLQKLSENGKGDMEIRCMDKVLHKDEVSINYSDNSVLFRGYLFNFDVTQKVRQFCNDIEEAKRKFYEDKK